MAGESAENACRSTGARVIRPLKVVESGAQEEQDRRNGNRRTDRLWIAAISLFWLSLMSAMVFQGVVLARFDVGYAAPLQRAATATNPRAILADLGRAIHYAEANGLTQGNTSDPPVSSNDLLAWHRTLIATYAEVVTLTPETPALARREILGRVRARLIRPTPPRLRCPQDLPLFPYQGWYDVWLFSSLGGFILLSLRSLIHSRRSS